VALYYAIAFLGEPTRTTEGFVGGPQVANILPFQALSSIFIYVMVT
jgi:hypothetical protein